jgi:hypothetical protein
MWLPLTTISLLLLIFSLEIEANRQRSDKNAHKGLNRHRPNRSGSNVHVSGNIIGHNSGRNKSKNQHKKKDSG